MFSAWGMHGYDIMRKASVSSASMEKRIAFMKDYLEQKTEISNKIRILIESLITKQPYKPELTDHQFRLACIKRVHTSVPSRAFHYGGILTDVIK